MTGAFSAGALILGVGNILGGNLRHAHDLDHRGIGFEGFAIPVIHLGTVSLAYVTA